jgi:hypothetical protein
MLEREKVLLDIQQGCMECNQSESHEEALYISHCFDWSHSMQHTSNQDSVPPTLMTQAA